MTDEHIVALMAAIIYAERGSNTFSLLDAAKQAAKLHNYATEALRFHMWEYPIPGEPEP